MIIAHVRVAVGAHSDARRQGVQGMGICWKCEYLGECLVSLFPRLPFSILSIADILKGVA